MVQQTRKFIVTLDTTPKKILASNTRRASYTVINQDAAVAAYLGYGESDGPKVDVAGNHEGERVGPNGGYVFDNDDKDCVYGVSPAQNIHIHVTEIINSFHTLPGASK